MTSILLRKPDRNLGLLPHIGIALGVTASILRGYVWSRGHLNAEAIGYMVGGLLFPLGFGYLFAGRWKVRSLNRFALIFLLLCVFELMLGLASLQGAR